MCRCSQLHSACVPHISAPLGLLCAGWTHRNVYTAVSFTTTVLVSPLKVDMCRTASCAREQDTHTCMHTHARTYACTHMHARSRTHTHTHTHTHTYTHTHTPVLSCSYSVGVSPGDQRSLGHHSLTGPVISISTSEWAGGASANTPSIGFQRRVSNSSWQVRPIHQFQGASSADLQVLVHVLHMYLWVCAIKS